MAIRVLRSVYEKLHSASFWVLVRPGSEQRLSSMEFLTYDTVDQERELPIFTSPEVILSSISSGAIAALIAGPELWTRLLEVVGDGGPEIAVNPGQSHGIRLTKSMMLGMIAMYGTPSSEQS
jgi:hypothetical protein